MENSGGFESKPRNPDNSIERFNEFKKELEKRAEIYARERREQLQERKEKSEGGAIESVSYSEIADAFIDSMGYKLANIIERIENLRRKTSPEFAGIISKLEKFVDDAEDLLVALKTSPSLKTELKQEDIIRIDGVIDRAMEAVSEAENTISD